MCPGIRSPILPHFWASTHTHTQKERERGCEKSYCPLGAAPDCAQRQLLASRVKRRQERSEQKIIPFFFHSRLSLSFHSFFVRLSLAVDSGFSLPPPPSRAVFENRWRNAEPPWARNCGSAAIFFECVTFVCLFRPAWPPLKREKEIG